MRTEILIEQKVREILQLLEIQETESNIDTPKRVAKMLNQQLLCNRNNNNMCELVSKMTKFKNSYTNRPICVKDIDFYSMCEHHLLPFFGKCDIEYIPRDYILGLSKFPRVVKYFSKKPQVQERLTTEIGEFLFEMLNPKYLRVTLRDVTHTCVSARGIEAKCETDTEYIKGEK